MNTSVGPEHAPFSGGRYSSLQRCVSQTQDLYPIIRVKQIFPISLGTAKAPRWQTVHCFQFRCPGINSRPNIRLETSNASSLLRQSQPFLAGTQRLFRLFAPSNV